MDIKFENSITPQEYNELRNKVNWKTIDIIRTKKALQESKYVKKLYLIINLLLWVELSEMECMC